MKLLIISCLLFASALAQTGSNLLRTDYNKQLLDALRFINKSDEGQVMLFNKEFQADNVIDFDLNPGIMDHIRDEFDLHIRPYVNLTDGGLEYEFGSGNHEFYVMTMPRWHSNIRWVSANNKATYDIFYKFVKQLGLLEIFSSLIDYDEELVVYSIFFVVRSKSLEHNFHLDWSYGTNVNAFTMMTPLDDMNVNLAYKDVHNEIQQYKYRLNEAITFGEGFYHSTDIGQDDEPKALFCITIGTDKLRDWPKIEETATYQGGHFMHPTKGFISNSKQWASPDDRKILKKQKEL